MLFTCEYMLDKHYNQNMMHLAGQFYGKLIDVGEVQECENMLLNFVILLLGNY